MRHVGWSLVEYLLQQTLLLLAAQERVTIEHPIDVRVASLGNLAIQADSTATN